MYLRSRVVAALVAAGCVLAMTSVTHALDIFWRNPNGGAFSSTGNWGGGLVPSNTDVANFSVNTTPPPFLPPPYTVTFSANVTNQALVIRDDLVVFDLNTRTYATTTAAGIAVGNNAGSLGSLTVTDGTINVTTAGFPLAAINVGAVANARGSLVVGSAGRITGAPNLNVGHLHTGGLAVTSGGVVSIGANTSTIIGNNAGVNGVATITGIGSALTTNGLTVGNSGNGTLNLDILGMLQVNANSVMGNNTGSTATANVTNSAQWLTTGNLTVGNSGQGTLNISAAGLVRNVNGVVGVGSGSSGTVTVEGGNSLWDNTGSLIVGDSGAGTLSVTNGGRVQSDIGNVGLASGSTGTVSVDGAGSRWDNSDGFLSVGAAGEGTLIVSGGGIVQSFASTIANSRQSTGLVTVNGDSSLWDNSGSLTVSSLGEASLSITAGGTVQSSAGTVGLGFEGTGEGIGMVSVDGDGSLWDNSGPLVVGDAAQGTPNITVGGTLNITAGGTVRNVNGTVGAASGGTGHVTVDGVGSLWENSQKLTIGKFGQGTLDITDGGRVVSVGLLLDTANAIGSSSGSSGVVTVDGDGSLWEIVGFLIVGDLGEGTLRITGGGIVQNNSGLVGSFINSATGHVTVEGDGSQWLNSETLSIGNEGAGTLHITDGGKVTTGSDASIGQKFGSTGTVFVSSTLAGADSVWEIGGRLAVGLNLGSPGGGVGTLRIQPGGKVTVAEDTVVSEDLLSLEGGVFATSGISFQQGGFVGANFAWTSGTLHVGVFQGDLANSAGVLAPGNSIGATEIQGNYNQFTNGTLEIEVGPVGQGAQNDSVSVTGTATLDGQLNLGLINGAAPLPSQTFIILDANTLIGAFDNIFNGQRLTTTDGRGSFVVNYGAGSAFDPTQIILSAFEAIDLPGDYNKDGTVNAADYTVWRNTLGSTTNLAADGSGNGTVDTADYNFWHARFGQTSGGGAVSSSTAAVPEPASIALIVLAAITMMLGRSTCSHGFIANSSN